MPTTPAESSPRPAMIADDRGAVADRVGAAVAAAGDQVQAGQHLPGQVDVARVDAGVDHRDGHAVTRRVRPRAGDVQSLEVPLLGPDRVAGRRRPGQRPRSRGRRPVSAAAPSAGGSRKPVRSRPAGRPGRPGPRMPGWRSRPPRAPPYAVAVDPRSAEQHEAAAAPGAAGGARSRGRCAHWTAWPFSRWTVDGGRLLRFGRGLEGSSDAEYPTTWTDRPLARRNGSTGGKMRELNQPDSLPSGHQPAAAGWHQGRAYRADQRPLVRRARHHQAR